MANNPFESIDVRLSKIESLLKELKKGNDSPVYSTEEFKHIPINSIFQKKLLSKPSFYKHVKDGLFKLYKIGGRSFVDKDEFESAFREIRFQK